MQIRISDMPAEGISLADSIAVEQFPELITLTQEGQCRFRAPIQVTLFIAPVAGMYRVEGKLRTAVGLTCSLCLVDFDHRLASHFHVTFTRGVPGGGDADAEGHELKPEEMGLVLFEGEEIDFRDTLQEQAILALPMQPKCRRDCQGLCAQCGANLNQGACGCSAQAVDPRLAVLKQLKLEE